MTKELIRAIFARRSIRKYTAELVSEKDVKTMLEAAMAAPSASNRKPWHFIAVTDRQILDILARAHPYGKMLLKAPLCVAVCGDKNRFAPLLGAGLLRGYREPPLGGNCARSRSRLARRSSLRRTRQSNKESAEHSREHCSSQPDLYRPSS